MAHVKQQIREAVGTLLSASPTNWKEVIESRLPNNRRIMPFLQVYTEDEDVEPISITTPYLYDRTINLVVRANVRIPNDLESIEDTLDTVQEEIEQTLTHIALKAQQSGVQKTLLQSSAKSIVDDDDEIFAIVELNYAISVNTTEGTPSL